MKDQYFGDINDYRKYGLLRALQHGANLDLLVAWMLTPDDGTRDGEFRSYLREPHRWKHFDPELYAGLAALLSQNNTRTVSLLESSNLIPRAAFHSSLVPDERGARERWRAGLLATASEADVVFLDPDNGIEVKSKPIGRKGSSKYLAWQEIDALWSAGRSLLIYQHYPREPRDRFAVRITSELRTRTGASFCAALATAHVVFLLVAQPRHESALDGAMQHLKSRWAGQISVVGYSAG